MNNEIASKHDNETVTKSEKYLYMKGNGTILPDWSVRIPANDGKVHQCDPYGGILYTYTLGVDLFAVRRDRVTTVTETFTIVG
jgi:hypothetical protein